MRGDIYDFNPCKARWLSPRGCTISAFDHIKKESQISGRNILPHSSFLFFSFLLLKKRAFIFRFTHSQWEGHSLFIPPSFGILISLFDFNVFGVILRCFRVVWHFDYCFCAFFSSLVHGRDGKGWEKRGILDSGGEASLDGAGTEACGAAGGFGSSASGMGTLSDICLLAAAGAAAWLDAGKMLERWSIQPQPAQLPAAFSDRKHLAAF